jgi:hypothetical protein
MEDIDAAHFRLLRWEWLAARIVFLGGFGIALIAAVATSVMKPAAPTVSAPLTGQEVQREHMAKEFCISTLGVAQAFGVVPGFAKPTSEPERTPTKGRYTCLAQAGQTGYAITIDLMCTDLSDARCFNLYSVKQGDGTTLFQRQG